MKKCKIIIELEVEYDEEQYNGQGILEVKEVEMSFEEEYKEKTEHQIGYDFEFKVISSAVHASDGTESKN